MCYPCRCPRRSVSCHGGDVCCPRPCCRERSRSTCSPRVIFPGEFQKFSDMIPPSFLLKQPPKCEKAKKKSKCACQADKGRKCLDRGNKGHEDNNEQARISGECVEMTAVPGNPCQPTDTPWCGTNGPWENPMAIGMPPEPQWVCVDCPATICFPRDPPGLQAAGLPTKRSPPFNPCTGQAYQSEQRQVMVGNYNEAAQGPTYNQFGQGVNNPCYQFNPSHFGDGAISYEPNRNQPNLYEARVQPYSQCCQGINMCPGPANPYYPYDGEDGTCSPPPGDHRSLSPQGEKRSKGQRKGKQTREGKVSKAPESRKGCNAGQHHQYNQDNFAEGAKQPNRGPRQNLSSGHVSQCGKRSTSQGTRNGSREAPRSDQHNRSNCRNPREESRGCRQDPQLKQSGRVAQQNPAVGKGVSQYGNRSKSSELRNETRRDNSARVPHPCKSRTMSPERAPRGDGRSKSLAKRNDPREQRSENMPKSNLHFYPQNVGMSFGPSNQHYVAECPSPDPIYINQESTVGDSGSQRQRSLSQRGPSTRRNGESRKDRESPSGNQPELRFNPNNQCCQYYMSDECFCPPSPGDMRSPREKSLDLASNDRSQLLNRVRRSTNESRSLDDGQMSAYPSKTSKKPPADRTTGANKSTCKQCTQAKPCKPRPTLADILANEVSSQPHVLMLSTQRDQKREKKKIQKTCAEPEIPETQDQCGVEDEVISCDDSLEDSSSCSENEEDKPQKKTNEKAQKKTKEKTQEKCKKKCHNKAQEEAEESSNNDDAAESSGSPPNSCWMGCPIPWSCCYGPCGPYSGQWNGPCNGPCRSPCNGPFYYCGNRCTGCYQCCNYRCNPCGGYCCSQPPVSQVVKCGKASTKSTKEKPPVRKDTHKRSQGGAFESFLPFLQPPPTPTPSFPVSNYSTMPGYYPTAYPPQFISPYSGHWQANEVVANPMFSKQYP